MSRNKIKRRKRMNFPQLMLCGLLVTAVLTAIFASALDSYISDQINYQSMAQIDQNMSDIQKRISKSAAKYGKEELTRRIDHDLALSTYFNICLRQFIFDEGSDNMVQVTPYFSTENHAVSALIDTDDNIVSTNKLVMRTIVRLDETDESVDMYLCDCEKLNIPEVSALFADIEELYSRCGNTGDVELTIDSIYYDSTRHIFIPRKGTVWLMRYKNPHDVMFVDVDENVEEELKIDITLDESKYGLEVMDHSKDRQTPYYYMTNMFGCPSYEFDKNIGSFSYSYDKRGNLYNNFITYENSDDHHREFSSTETIYIDGEQYQLLVRFVVDRDDPQFKDFFRKWVMIFGGSLLFITFLFSWRKSALNKAKNYFEDYQRDLTNHLAHDIKTPLMAIGGYTENIMEGKLTDDEKQNYLHSILDNIAFTDSIITRTLFLNSMDSRKIKREKLDAGSIVGNVLEKYAVRLDDKSISHSVTGSAEISAERDSFETVIENLISNAVKYTPGGGSIRVGISRKQIIVTNNVTGKMSTKELMRPFVRGDEARSNTQGSGLGLSIAERAALANGFKLKISCTDSEFRAVIKL